MFAWVEIAEELFKKVFRSKWFHWTLQAISVGLCVWWWFNVPAPGKAVLALTIVAVVMTIEGLTGWQRALWLVIVFTLAFLENRAIDKDRRDFSDAEKGRREVENSQFSNIGDSITSNVKKLLDQSDEQFNATVTQQSTQFDASMKKAQINIDEVTGGNSYAIVIPVFTSLKQGTNTFPLMIRVCNKCRYSIWDTHVYLQPDVHSSELGALIYEGMVNPTAGVHAHVPISPDPATQTNYRVSVYARNKATVELLRIRFNTQSHEWRNFMARRTIR